MEVGQVSGSCSEMDVSGERARYNFWLDITPISDQMKASHTFLTTN